MTMVRKLGEVARYRGLDLLGSFGNRESLVRKKACQRVRQVLRVLRPLPAGERSKGATFLEDLCLELLNLGDQLLSTPIERTETAFPELDL